MNQSKKSIQIVQVFLLFPPKKQWRLNPYMFILLIEITVVII